MLSFRGPVDPSTLTRCWPDNLTGVDQEEYVERVLSVAEQIPVGRVTTYGAIADAVGVGGPRQVGRVMSM